MINEFSAYKLSGTSIVLFPVSSADSLATLNKPNIVPLSRIRKSVVSYKNPLQLPKEPQLKELKVYVGTSITFLSVLWLHKHFWLFNFHM